MFTTIEGNYADAVRLLTTAHTYRLTVKRRCLLLNAHFRKVESRTRLVAVDSGAGYLSSGFAHVDIISPGAFEKIGPIIRER